MSSELEHLKKELEYSKDLANRAWKALTDRDLEVEELRGVNEELKKAKARIEELDGVDVELKKAKAKLKKAKARIEELDGVDVELKKAKARIEELEGVDVNVELKKAKFELRKVQTALMQAKVTIDAERLKVRMLGNLEQNLLKK